MLFLRYKGLNQSKTVQPLYSYKENCIDFFTVMSLQAITAKDTEYAFY